MVPRYRRLLDRYVRARVRGVYTPARHVFDFVRELDPTGINFTPAAWAAVRASGAMLPGRFNPSRLDGAYLF